MDDEGPDRFHHRRLVRREATAPSIHLQDRADAEPGRRDRRQLAQLTGRQGSEPTVPDRHTRDVSVHLVHEDDGEATVRRGRRADVL